MSMIKSYGRKKEAGGELEVYGTIPVELKPTRC